MKGWKRLVQDEDGQDMAEYALLVGLIAVVVIASLVALGGGLNEVWQRASDLLS